ncbi:MAG: SDR family oxidoreductase [Nitrososphaerales archaeon]
MSTGKLDGKIALVTGAGSGIGKAMAELFAQNGCAVAVADVVPERVNEAVKRIESSGGRASGYVHNLSQMNEVDAMIDECAQRHGKIDILCNNAGIMDGAKLVAETTDELWKQVIDINLNAPFRACRKLIPMMLSRKSGIILNTASIAGVFGGRAGAAYTVSKHALIGLTKSIAASYGGGGIRCNAMVCGAVQTAIGIGSKEPSPLGLQMMQRTSATMPRLANPEEIAKLALFLVSDEASYLNGSCVVVDNGWSVY